MLMSLSVNVRRARHCHRQEKRYSHQLDFLGSPFALDLSLLPGRLLGGGTWQQCCVIALDREQVGDDGRGAGEGKGRGLTYQKRAPTLLSLLCHIRILLRGRDHSLSLGLFPQLPNRENINTHFFVMEGIVPGPQNVLKCMSAIPIRQSSRPGFLNTTAPGVTLDCQGSLNAEESLIPPPTPGVRVRGVGGGLPNRESGRSFV